MLKIKDNVDLTEKLFQKSDDEFDQIWSYGELLFDKDTGIINQNQFYVGGYLTAKRLENLYDLIKADLVVKVDD
jgi:hypothetical protein